MDCPEIRHLGDARSTPARPEIQENELTPKVGKRQFFPLQGLDREVGSAVAHLQWESPDLDRLERPELDRIRTVGRHGELLNVLADEPPPAARVARRRVVQ